MPTPSEPPKLARPTTLRLYQQQIDAIDAIAEQRGQLRSELLVEAVDHWLLLDEHGIDAVRIVAALRRPDQELAKIENTTAAALELVKEARARLVALTLNEAPQIF
jgi:hypothetical protein